MIRAMSHQEIAWDAEIEPPVELVTLAQAKEHARVDGAGDDNVILRLIQSERRAIERYIGHYLVAQRVRAWFGGFTGTDLPGHTKGMRDALELPIGPIYAPADQVPKDRIDAVLYETTNAAGEVIISGLASDGYELVYSAEVPAALGGAPNWHMLPLLRPPAGGSWPSSRGDGTDNAGTTGGNAARTGRAAVHVTYTAGIVISEADRSVVPADLISVLLDRIAYRLDNRGQPMPMALQQEFERMCDPYKVFTF